MIAIRCQDTVFLTTDFDDCVKELRATQATFQPPLHVTVRPAGLRIGVPEVRLHHPIVEFDETRTTRAAVLAVLAKYGCRERPPDSDASPAGPVAANPSPSSPPIGWRSCGATAPSPSAMTLTDL